MGLALACDMRVGCENSRFKTVFIETSPQPGLGVVLLLAQNRGRQQGVRSGVHQPQRGRRRSLPAWPLGPYDNRGQVDGGSQGTGPADRLLASCLPCKCPSGHCSAAWKPTWKTNSNTRPTASFSPGEPPTTWRSRRRPSASVVRRYLPGNNAYSPPFSHHPFVCGGPAAKGRRALRGSGCRWGPPSV